ncbi:MAG: hypothetical protein ABIE23_00695 [archaeon]
MVRDLYILSDSPLSLERTIIRKKYPINPLLFSEIHVVTDKKFKVGDLVLFRLLRNGCYNDMETLWGNRVPLKKGKYYIGVLCERGSTKFITAEFSSNKIKKNTVFNFVAQGGGIGTATGYSPALSQRNLGAPYVRVEGLLATKDGKILNIKNNTHSIANNIGKTKNIPTLLILGSGTDTGKTTIACKIIKELKQKGVSCATLKASGTGWYEDSLMHQNAGAFPSLNFTFVGLPTTYYVPKKTYLKYLSRLLSFFSDPRRIPENWIHPKLRRKKRMTPELLVIEHGGDLIFANIPTFLSSSQLMKNVFGIVICNESVVSVIGAINQLKKYQPNKNKKVKIYVSAPISMNPEAVYKRLETLLRKRIISSVFDVKKNIILQKKKRLSCKEYAKHYKNIDSIKILVEKIIADVGRN